MPVTRTGRTRTTIPRTSPRTIRLREVRTKGGSL
jgi:hypothetical protein